MLLSRGRGESGEGGGNKVVKLSLTCHDLNAAAINHRNAKAVSINYL